MNNKRNLFLIALLFVAVLSVCIIITIKESNAPASSSTVSTLSSSISQSSSSVVINSENNIFSTNPAASSLNNQQVEIFLKTLKQDNKNYQLFDFALSTFNLSENMIEAAASYYSDKQKPEPMVVAMSQYGAKNINLVDSSMADSGPYVFAENGKIKITGRNELYISILDTKTKEIYDCKVIYCSEKQGRSFTYGCEPTKRVSK